MARKQRDVARAGHPEPENKPWGPPPGMDDHGKDAEADTVRIYYDSLEGELLERFVADHGRRVRGLESALARPIDLIGNGPNVTSGFVCDLLSSLSLRVPHQGGSHGRLRTGGRAGDEAVVRLAE